MATEHFDLLVYILRFCTKINYHTPRTKVHKSNNKPSKFVLDIGQAEVLELDTGKKHFKDISFTGKG